MSRWSILVLTLWGLTLSACSDRPHVRVEPSGEPGADGTAAAEGSGQEGDGDPGSAAEGEKRPLRLLVFSRTEGYRHDSILPAKLALIAAAPEEQWSLLFSEEPGDFTPEKLASMDVVVFLMTTGDVLDGPEEAALERFVRDGGGFVGVHSASDTEYGWPFYRELVGAWFLKHPAIAPAKVRVEAKDHPITRGLPDPWERTDEWYDFRENPRERVNVLLTLDESSYPGGTMGQDHPIAWTREVERGRSFYSGMGHTAQSWQEPGFVLHLRRGVNWAGRRLAAD